MARADRMRSAFSRPLPPRRDAPGTPRRAEWAVFVALLALFGPTVASLARGAWQLPTYSHGSLVLAVALGWFVSRGRRFFRQPAPPPPRPRVRAGAALVSLGLGALLIGRWQAVPLIEAGAIVPLLLGCTLLLHGAALARALGFGYFFLLFVVPLPAVWVDALTQPMKLGVSVAAEALLHTFGLPVSRSGVMLAIGPYQLLVADACAGLNSLFMLEAFGLFYLNVMRHPSPARNLALAVLIVPISFAANVLRVVTLALVTLHFGDAAGQGLVHGFSGALLFAAALLLILPIDGLLRRRVGAPAPAMRQVRAPAAAGTPPTPALARRRVRLLAAAIGAAALLGATVTPRFSEAPVAAPFEAAIPLRFADWTALDAALPQVGAVAREPGGRVAPDADQPYDQVLVRSYRNTHGDTVMLTLAYGRVQRGALRIHAPERCYAASGFEVLRSVPTAMLLPHAGAPSLVGRHMLARGTRHLEAVSYWVRIGERSGAHAGAVAWYLFTEGLAGRIPDGVLVRASQVVPDAAAAPHVHAALDAFLAQLVAATPAATRRLLLH